MLEGTDISEILIKNLTTIINEISFLKVEKTISEVCLIFRNGSQIKSFLKVTFRNDFLRN
jgi:hypothetical protein